MQSISVSLCFRAQAFVFAYRAQVLKPDLETKEGTIILTSLSLTSQSGDSVEQTSLSSL